MKTIGKALFWGSYIGGVAALLVAVVVAAFLMVNQVSPDSVRLMLAYQQANEMQQGAVRDVLADEDFKPTEFARQTDEQKIVDAYLAKGEQGLVEWARDLQRAWEAFKTQRDRELRDLETQQQVALGLEAQTRAHRAQVDAQLEQLWALALAYQTRVRQDALLRRSETAVGFRQMLESAEEPEQAAKMLDPLPAQDIVGYLLTFKKQKQAMGVLAALKEPKKSEVAQVLNQPAPRTEEDEAAALNLSLEELQARKALIDAVLRDVTPPLTLGGKPLAVEDLQDLRDFLAALGRGYEQLTLAARAAQERAARTQ